MGLLDWFKTDKDSDETDEKPSPQYDPRVGTGWVPGVSDGSWLLPDWVQEARNSGYRDNFRRGGE